MSSLRQAILFLLQLSNYSFLGKRYSFSQRRPVRQWVLILPGSGCAWAKESGGCYMCGFYNELLRQTKGSCITRQDLLFMFQSARLFNFFRKFQEVVIYTGGSFLNDAEIPESAQLALIRRIAKIKQVECITVESRPEYIDIRKLAELKLLLKGKQLKVAIGLETQSDRIRTESVHKGFSSNDFAQALHSLKDQGIYTISHVFIKPLFLPEEASIREAIASARYALGEGANEVVFQAGTVHPHTRMYEEYQKGNYQPPDLNSIIAILKNTYALGNIQIADFNDVPRPVAEPQSCGKCSTLIKKALVKFRVDHDLAALTAISCDCPGYKRTKRDGY